MNRLVLFATAALTFAGIVSTPIVPRAWAQTFTTIDYPGATHTRLFSINPEGVMVGIYVVGTAFHGIRVTKYGIEAIDFPGAAVTAALGINPGGDIVGWYAY